MRHGVRSDADTVIIRNRWKSSNLQIVLLLLWCGGCVALGVWVDSRADKGSKLPFLVLLVMAAGIVVIGRTLRTSRQRTAVLDRDGIRTTPDGPMLRWSEITMVRAVFVPQQGYALAVARKGSVSVLAPTITVRVRRLRAIREACGPLMVLHPGVFLFDVLDEPSQMMPSADYLHRYSVASTGMLAAGQNVPPVSERTRRLRWVLVGLILALHGGVLVWQTASDDSASTSSTTFHFEMTPAVQQQIDELTADSDLCHGIWTAPAGWPPDAEVTTIRYLRGDTARWTLTAPAAGAVSFLPSGDLPRYSVNDIVESYGYHFVGSFTSTPLPPGDRLVLESSQRRLEVSCAEI